ncbi:DNA-directed RNA polymerase III subunit RPC7 [Episyrphus balteatus]|uniref:DNA-directed RNA polymerase III subunit RPC7 n=1 Tax=Episyrphus balteatus TaxID=286459 RepID=UPI002485531F|nr:DNA-directed RNA polymerase III subunit RPC7 [Episyrphus balteatus]XP_055843931.1 DNA-directed RNA polymerase III subunit RPC7 [Episyrphus balteatus]
MAGRGGRGGKTSSLTQEQLQAMGCIGKDMPQVQLAPPPTFPPLMSKPVTMETTASQNYQILWKEDFLSHMRDSPYYIMPKLTKANILRYSDQYNNALENSKTKTKADIPWQLMPSELSPMFNKRKTNSAAGGTNVPSKKSKTANIDDRLKVLEEKEKTDGDPELNEKKASDSEAEEEEEEDGMKADDEMDDENDYGNSYFDNGEAYNEEDDNLDDGPVY